MKQKQYDSDNDHMDIAKDNTDSYDIAEESTAAVVAPIPHADEVAPNHTMGTLVALEPTQAQLTQEHRKPITEPHHREDRSGTILCLL